MSNTEKEQLLWTVYRRLANQLDDKEHIKNSATRLVAFDKNSKPVYIFSPNDRLFINTTEDSIKKKLVELDKNNHVDSSKLNSSSQMPTGMLRMVETPHGDPMDIRPEDASSDYIFDFEQMNPVDISIRLPMGGGIGLSQHFATLQNEQKIKDLMRQLLTNAPLKDKIINSGLFDQYSLPTPSATITDTDANLLIDAMVKAYGQNCSGIPLWATIPYILPAYEHVNSSINIDNIVASEVTKYKINNASHSNFQNTIKRIIDEANNNCTPQNFDSHVDLLDPFKDGELKTKMEQKLNTLSDSLKANFKATQKCFPVIIPKAPIPNYDWIDKIKCNTLQADVGKLKNLISQLQSKIRDNLHCDSSATAPVVDDLKCLVKNLAANLYEETAHHSVTKKVREEELDCLRKTIDALTTNNADLEQALQKSQAALTVMAANLGGGSGSSQLRELKNKLYEAQNIDCAQKALSIQGMNIITNFDKLKTLVDRHPVDNSLLTIQTQVGMDGGGAIESQNKEIDRLIRNIRSAALAIKTSIVAKNGQPSDFYKNIYWAVCSIDSILPRQGEKVLISTLRSALNDMTKSYVDNDPELDNNKPKTPVSLDWIPLDTPRNSAYVITGLYTRYKVLYSQTAGNTATILTRLIEKLREQAQAAASASAQAEVAIPGGAAAARADSWHKTRAQKKKCNANTRKSMVGGDTNHTFPNIDAMTAEEGGFKPTEEEKLANLLVNAGQILAEDTVPAAQKNGFLIAQKILFWLNEIHLASPEDAKRAQVSKEIGDMTEMIHSIANGKISAQSIDVQNRIIDDLSPKGQALVAVCMITIRQGCTKEEHDAMVNEVMDTSVNNTAMYVKVLKNPESLVQLIENSSVCNDIHQKRTNPSYISMNITLKNGDGNILENNIATRAAEAEAKKKVAEAKRAERAAADVAAAEAERAAEAKRAAATSPATEAARNKVERTTESTSTNDSGKDDSGKELQNIREDFPLALVAGGIRKSSKRINKRFKSRARRRHNKIHTRNIMYYNY